MICLSKRYISKHVSCCTLCTLEIYEAHAGTVRDRILFPMANYQLCCFSEIAFHHCVLFFSHQLNGDESIHLHLQSTLISTDKKFVSQTNTSTNQLSSTSDNDWLTQGKEIKRAAVDKYTLSPVKALMEQFSALRWSLSSQDRCWAYWPDALGDGLLYETHAGICTGKRVLKFTHCHVLLSWAHHPRADKPHGLFRSKSVWAYGLAGCTSSATRMWYLIPQLSQRRNNLQGRNNPGPSSKRDIQWRATQGYARSSR